MKIQGWKAEVLNLSEGWNPNVHKYYKLRLHDGRSALDTNSLKVTG